MLPAALVFCALVGGPAWAESAPDPRAAILPLAEVRPGMVGQAWTAFQGIKPEPFQVRVVSVIRNFLPKQDIILVRSDDPKVQGTGIAAGMSGSPVYVDGRLMGAVAYGWAFSKEPLAGVTPIESMQAESTRPQRTSDRPGPLGTAPVGEPRLQRVAVPLAVTGLSDQALSEVAEMVRPLGLLPVRAGGVGTRTDMAPGVLQPGVPVGAMLVDGDLSATAMGTLTAIDGGNVLAFGHPMMGVGQVDLPLVLGEVHTIVPSLSSSMKLASPVAEIGALVQDRPAGVVGQLGRHAPRVAMNVRVVEGSAPARDFHCRLARHPKLLPVLASMVLTGAVADGVPEVSDMVLSLTTRLGVQGQGDVEINDQVFSPEGLSPRVLTTARGLRAVTELLANPFAPAVIDHIDITIRVDHGRDVAEIVGAALPGDRLRAGQTVPLRLWLRPYAGQEFMETVLVTLPASLAGRTVKVDVASGAQVKPDVPRPQSLRGLMDNLGQSFPGSSLVVSLSTPEDGVSLRGQLLPSLPPSALDTIDKPIHQARRAESYRVTERSVFPGTRILTGKQELTIQVRGEDASVGP